MVKVIFKKYYESTEELSGQLVSSSVKLDFNDSQHENFFPSVTMDIL